MNSIFGFIGSLIGNIFGSEPQGNTSSNMMSRKDNRLRDEDGRVYTVHQENSEMDPGYDDDYDYMYEDEGEYEEEGYDDYVDYESGDLPDEDIEYLREEYGDEY